MAMTQPYQTWEGAREENLPLKAFMRRANRDSEHLPCLQNLRKVYMIVDFSGRCDDERYYNHIEFLDSFDLFVKLPSITSVGIDTLVDDQLDEPLVKLRESNITELCINTRGRTEFTHHEFNGKAFLKALLAHKTTLDSLDLDTEVSLYTPCWNIEDEFEDWDEEDYTREFLGSFWDTHGKLKDFIALKNLSIAIDVLFYLIGDDNEPSEQQPKTTLLEGIPDNLEYLCIRGYQ
ncbi:hypothetical protein N7493_010333 [Penicillium malachiteum]|uniref:Uncharacterized protein n=1 Tax=Penicillium malachiteum TaxID=1324776 RepID=A0AAD6MRH1_9EURO|nr:hypothetical protein N7493_010333 [Penicillium malachiteum]